MELLLVISLSAAVVLYTYDLLVSGPAWARVLLAAACSGSALAAFDVTQDEARTFLASAFLALLWVGLLQWIQVARDAAMFSAINGRRR